MSQRQSLDKRVEEWLAVHLDNLCMDPPQSVALVGLLEEETQIFNAKVYHAMHAFCKTFGVHASEEVYNIIQILVTEDLWKKAYLVYGAETQQVEMKHFFQERTGTPTSIYTQKLIEVAKRPQPQAGLRDCYYQSGFKKFTIQPIYTYVQKRLAARGQPQ